MVVVTKNGRLDSEYLAASHTHTHTYLLGIAMGPLELRSPPSPFGVK